MTDQLRSCACLIISDTNNRNIVLAHIDDKTMNIHDPDIGLISWIRMIPDHENIENISIYCGRGFQESVLNPMNYEIEIRNILISNEMNSLIEKVKMHNVKEETAEIIFRDSDELESLLACITEEKVIASLTEVDSSIEQPDQYYDSLKVEKLKEELRENNGILFNKPGDPDEDRGPSENFALKLKFLGFSTNNTRRFQGWRQGSGESVDSLVDIEDDKCYIKKGYYNTIAIEEELFGEEFNRYDIFHYIIAIETGLSIKKDKEDRSLPFPPICYFDGTGRTNDSWGELDRKNGEMIKDYQKKIIKIINELVSDHEVDSINEVKDKYRLIRTAFKKDHDKCVLYDESKWQKGGVLESLKLIQVVKASVGLLETPSIFCSSQVTVNTNISDDEKSVIADHEGKCLASSDREKDYFVKKLIEGSSETSEKGVVLFNKK